MADVSLIDRLLDVIENNIVPKTAEGVAHGNKLFGAAILRKEDRSLVLAETNNEIENPLWHGEMHCLKRFYEMPKAERVDTKDAIFLSTHEPCSLCLSAITWAGFDNFYYLFSHEDSRDSFAIPHDLKILKEVFTLDPGGYHLMFIDLTRQPRKGENFPATLTFEKAGSVTVDFAVEGIGESGADAHGSHAD